jgi:AraC-like DNA-binding protein
MDLLTHILQEAGLVRRLLDLRRLGSAKALRFPCERSLGLHVVTQGSLWIHAPLVLPSPLELGTGDMAFMARGCVHVLATSADVAGLPVQSVTELAVASSVASPLPSSIASSMASTMESLADNSSAAGSHVMSGAYQLWNTPLHPLFAQLPAWFVLRANEVPQLSPIALSVGLMRAELDTPQLGSQSVLHGLLDVVFTYVLRAMIQRHASAAGMGHVMSDPPVYAAVTLLHEDCAQQWTLDVLAKRVGLSRTGFAERFRDAVGDTPLQYLRTIRMQHAVRLLGDTSQTMEQVASAVGYHDAFSFSKVFKRTVGLSPRDFRRRNDDDRSVPFRFTAG